jgi:hypothetical protein
MSVGQALVVIVVFCGFWVVLGMCRAAAIGDWMLGEPPRHDEDIAGEEADGDC